MQRRKSLRRSPMKRGRKRSTAEQDRIYGPAPFRDWLHQQPCVITGLRTDIVAAHVINGGLGRKADWRFTVPMTDALHRELHQHGVKTFEAKYGVNLVCLAGAVQDRWQRWCLSVVHDDSPLCVTCQASLREVGARCASCAYQPPAA